MLSHSKFLPVYVFNIDGYLKHICFPQKKTLGCAKHLIYVEGDVTNQ